MTHILTKQDYLATFRGTMKDVTDVGDTTIDIWPYVKETRRDLEMSEYAIEHHLVEHVYRSGDGSYDHVLIPYGVENVYLAIIVDLVAHRIYGHHLLDLNEEYRVAYAQT